MTRGSVWAAAAAMVLLAGCRDQQVAERAAETRLAKAPDKTQTAGPRTFPVSAAVPAGAAPVRREFKSWRLVCDNTRTCRAQPESYDGSLGVRRDGGPAGELVVVLHGQDPGDGSRLDVASIRVEGARAAVPTGWREDREAGSASLTGEAALTFLRALADAKALTYVADGARREVPLDGVKAALLAMDEAQGRVGGVTALVRPGPAPASAVPPGLPVPQVRAKPAPGEVPEKAAFLMVARTAADDLLRADDCETGEDVPKDDVHPLAEGKVLVILGCRLGAHSASYLLLEGPADEPRAVRPLVFPAPPADVDQMVDGSAFYSDVEWDAPSATLYSSGYACAHTCGTNAQWTYDGRGFVLTGYLTYAPGGAEPLEIYRTEVVGGR